MKVAGSLEELLRFLQVCAGVHAEAGSSTAKAVSLGPELAAVAGLTVQHLLVAVHVGRVQHLVAHTALEALLVEGEFADHAGLCGVDGLAAHGALDLSGGLEGHAGGGVVFFRKITRLDKS